VARKAQAVFSAWQAPRVALLAEKMKAGRFSLKKVLTGGDHLRYCSHIA
jgi:hypothetical protein